MCGPCRQCPLQLKKQAVLLVQVRACDEPRLVAVPDASGQAVMTSRPHTWQEQQPGLVGSCDAEASWAAAEGASGLSWGAGPVQAPPMPFQWGKNDNYYKCGSMSTSGGPGRSLCASMPLLVAHRVVLPVCLPAHRPGVGSGRAGGHPAEPEPRAAPVARHR